MSSKIFRLWAVGLAAALLLNACGAPTSTPLPVPTSMPATSTVAAATALPAASATPDTASVARPAPPVLGAFDAASVENINLNDYPVIPKIGPAALAVYRAGLRRGNNPRVFSKLGDCMTETPNFLTQFSEGKYNLGEYQDLQAVIDQFAGQATHGAGTPDSFAAVSLAAAQGFNVAGPLDSTWANPKFCKGGESPLACEYRVANPSLAILMFGTNDATYTDAPTYDFYLRSLVIETLDRDILPILSTFPVRPENLGQTVLLNKIVVKVAADYQLPLVNLYRALEPLPNHGVDPKDTIHLSVPADKRVDAFVEPNLQAGFTVRNLVTLQALQAVLKAAGE